MRWQDVSVVAGTAAATALAILTLSWAGRATAKDGRQQEIQWPVLRGNGAEITLSTDQASYKLGEQPIVRLVVVNPTGAAVSLEPVVRMLVRQPSSFVSRVALGPQAAWQHKAPLTLGAGERKTLSIPTNVKVAAGTTVYFQLQVDKAAVVTRPVAVPGPGNPNQAGTEPVTLLPFQVSTQGGQR